MSKKKDKGLVLESPGVSIHERDINVCNLSDVLVMDGGEFSENPIYIPISPPRPSQFRGKTIDLLLIDEDGFFFNKDKKEVQPTPKKPSSERKRRLRLLK